MENQYLNSLVKLYERDIIQLEKEIASYPDDQSLWVKNGMINNSAGNLAMHLCGNLQHYIGKHLGGSDYVRNRPNEFSVSGLTKEEVLAEIVTTKAAVLDALQDLKPSSLLSNYPEKVFDYDMTVMYFLNHLLAHLNYHLGQINYHRRLLTGSK